MSVVVEKQLPKGWAYCDFTDVIFFQEGPGLRSFQFTTSGMKVINVTNIVNEKLEISNTNKYISLDEFSKKYSHFAVEENDIVMASSGATFGKSAFVTKESLPLMMNTSVIRLHPIDSNNLNRKFLNLFLKTEFFKTQIRKFVTGSAQPNFGPTHLKKTKFIILPLNEQKRIVAKIEELFSLVDSAKDALEKTKVLLKQYRQSVLKHAFEGKLTEEWRKLFNNSESVKDILLKKSIEFNKKKKIELDFSKLPRLPSNWKWVIFEQIIENTPNAMKAGPFGSSLKKESYVNSGYKIYGQEQVLKNDPYYGDYYVNEKKFDELKSCQVKSGDLLISLVGTIGKTLLLPIDCEQGIINPRLIKISLDYEITNPKYIQQYFNSISAKIFFKISSHGGTMDIINLGILKKLPIPFPHIVEQNEIILKIEENFSLIDKNEKIVDELLLQCKQIKNSILKQAFEGKLVPQDPNDEPAEVLLQRIKEEKNHGK